MRIGVLTHPDQRLDNFGNPTVETTRYRQEIEKAGHAAVNLNYFKMSIAVLHNKPEVYQHVNGDENRLEPVSVDAVIPTFDEKIPQALWTLSALMMKGVASIARPGSIGLAKNKLMSQLKLTEQGIPTPDMIAPLCDLPEHPETLLEQLEADPEKGLVFKALHGTEGKGTIPLGDRSDAMPLIEYVDHEPFLLQEFLTAPEDKVERSDVRIVVLNGEVLATMLRVAKEKEKRAGLSTGGTGHKYEPTPEEIDMSIRATRILGLNLAGVDIMHSEKGSLVIEVNPFPGMLIEQITGVNIARKIVGFAIKEAGRVGVEETRAESGE